MRRGAPVAQQDSTRKRPVVAADVDDLEGGAVLGGGDGGGGLAQSSSVPYLKPPPSFNGTSRSDSGSFHEMDPLTIPTINDDSQKKGPRRRKHMHHYDLLTNLSPDSLRLYAIILFIVIAVISPFLPVEWSILSIVFGACSFGAIASLWLSRSVLQCDDGTAEMRAVSDPIREGAEGFLHVQYTAIAKFALPLAGLIVLSYQFRPVSGEPKGVAVLGNGVLGIVAALGFVFGAVCSALSGYVR